VLNHIDMARGITGEIEVVMKAMVGLVYGAVNRNGIPNRARMTALKLDLIEMATAKTETALSMLDKSAHELASHESRRAASEAGVELSNVAMFENTAIPAVKERIAYEICAYATEGARIANGVSQRAMINHSAGWPVEKAVSLAIASNKGRLGRWGEGKVGVRSNLSHMLFLLVADALQQTKAEAYVMKSVELGATKFRLSQPGHDRDGLEFHAAMFPVDELHPQSEAVILAVR
jgi:hypothetical protein